MKQDFRILVRHFIVYGLGVYLTKLIGFFMIPIYTAYLVPADYAVLELLDLTTFIIGMVVGLGISNSIIRFYTDCRDDKSKSEVISTSFFYILMFSAIVYGLVAIYSKPISAFIFKSGESTHGGSDLSYFIKLMAIAGFTDILATIGTSFLQAEKKSAIFTTVSIGRFIIAVSLNIYFIVFLQLGLAGVLYTHIITSFLFLIVQTILMRKHLRFLISFERGRAMFRYGAPLIISTMSMFVIHFADRFFLERSVGLSVLGVYSLSYKFAMVLPALLYGPFEMIWNSQMFDLYKKGEEGKKVITYYFKYLLAASCLLITCYSLGIRELIMIMADPKFHDAYRAVPFLLIAFLFIGLASISSAGIFFVKKTIYRGLANVYGAVIALSGYYFLIPLYGYWGAVATTLLALAVRFAALEIYSQRFYKLKYQPLVYIKLIGASLIAYGIGSLISIDHLYLSMLIKSGTGLVLFVGLSLLFGVFNRQEMAALKSLIGEIKTKLPGLS